VAQALELGGPFLDQKQLRLTVEVPRGECFVDGDDVRLAQVLGNLLSNAARFSSPGGEVTLSAERQGLEVVVRIADRGAGIEAELLPRIFELFTQGPASGPAGLGVGLAIVERLVALHGGRVMARSDGPGRGSEFIIRLPAAPRERAVEAVAEPRAGGALPARRVLVVDDNRDTAESLGELLSALGHEVRVAYDGAGALEVAASGFGPEVALLDLGLPGMDGYQLAGALRERVPAVRLIAITGYGQDQDRARASAAGFDRHLVKPVDLDALVRMIEPPQGPQLN
jgi:CheY-like chemotaxis protein